MAAQNVLTVTLFSLAASVDGCGGGGSSSGSGDNAGNSIREVARWTFNIDIIVSMQKKREKLNFVEYAMQSQFYEFNAFTIDNHQQKEWTSHILIGNCVL